MSNERLPSRRRSISSRDPQQSTPIPSCITLVHHAASSESCRSSPLPNPKCRPNATQTIFSPSSSSLSHMHVRKRSDHDACQKRLV
ncbi:hypothetical protein CERZMDRAFT_91088 [Cercospora zeae-maydis SCOH1-5]|uniref:Uncharacterized protein n=1 Tax=Cercospora zeae-maydis SCOH1-5 TaxID=717836 RepID=A0A6A6FAS0_9PEZI|nr:hypothetical protein CERZMDRAFT_91088 [Cercospora zeae-maydis SCOH1-5]